MNTLSPPALDLEGLRSRFEGRTELLRRVIKIFAEQTPQLLTRLREAARRGDASAVKSAAHTLKGSFLQLGALAAADLALQLEQTQWSETQSSSPIEQLELKAAEVLQLLTDLADSPDL